MNLGTIKGIVPNLIRTRGKGKKPMSPKKAKNLMQKKSKKEEVKDLYYD